jgi:beta-barrel assembly-enhancing protease
MNLIKVRFLIVCYVFLAFVTVSNSVYAQQNFNDYKTLASVGTIPNDFTQLTYEKIKVDLKNDRTTLKGQNEKIFLEGIHYSIDELLHSGVVIYGDEITMYLNSIAQKLLKDDATLQKELRFYTLKSNVTNAFSTDQGIVFVTTGLISQLTSEAQLAFVLAHEISHYTEKHVVETFDWKNKTNRGDRTIERLSQYSKEKELDADRLGLKMYQAAGYSKEEILPTFDVLMFSYLPFDELEMPKTYFNTDYMFVPETMFSKEKYPIKAVENEDDSKSSHPNIKKRKESVEKEMGLLSNWGKTTSFLGDEKFKYIRKIARFESIRNDVIDANYADAVYSIFLLEKEYPNSIYLHRMKAKAWLGMAQMKEVNKLTSTLQKVSDYEGEVAELHFFLRKLDKNALITLALRQVEDIRKKQPTDKEIQLIWERMVKTTTITEKFDLKAFSSFKFAEAKAEYEKVKADTVSKVEKTTENLSKYEKIKKKKNSDDPENFDNEKFYLYGISDIIKSEEFIATYDKFQKENDALKEQKAKEDLMSRAERKKMNKKFEENQIRVEANDLIFVEPIVYRYKHGQIDKIKSEKLGEDFVEIIEKTAADLDMNVTTISSSNLKKLGTPGFNERAVLLSYLQQITNEEKIDVFPVDYSLLSDIQTNYGTSKVMFSILEHSYQPHLSAALYSSFLFFPAALIVFPLEILMGNETELNVIIMDIDKGGIAGGQFYNYKEPLSNLSIGAHLYDVLSQVKSKPL